MALALGRAQKRLHLIERRDAIHRAEPGAAHGSRGVGESQRPVHGPPWKRGEDETTAKHVAGPGRVHGLDLEPRRVAEAVTVERHGSPGPECHAQALAE